jgi:hypothetical protein
MTAATAGVEQLDELGEVGQGTGEAVNLGRPRHQRHGPHELLRSLFSRKVRWLSEVA